MGVAPEPEEVQTEVVRVELVNGDQTHKLEGALDRGANKLRSPPPAGERAGPTQPGGAGTPVKGRPARKEQKPKAPKKERVPEEHEKTLQAALQNAWKGYYGYHELVHATAKWQLKGIVRARILQMLEKEKASCFWIATCLTVGDAELTRFGLLAEKVLGEGRLDKGVAADEAVIMLREARVACVVYWHNPELGDISQSGQPEKRQKTYGPMHVLCGDAEKFAPHWLPIDRVKEGEKWKVPLTVLQTALRVADKVGKQKGKGQRKPMANAQNQYAVLDDEAGADEDEPEAEVQPEERRRVEALALMALLEHAPRVQEEEARMPALEPGVVAGPPSGGGSSSSSSSSAGSSSSSSSSLTRPGAAQPRGAGAQQPPDRIARWQAQVQQPQRLEQRRGVPRHVLAPRPPHQVPLALNEIQGGQLPFVDAAYSWNPPPCTRKSPWGAITRWYCANTSESCLGALQCEESCWRRWSTFGCRTLLYEARKEVLIGRGVAPGDWLFERVIGDHEVNSNLTAMGALRLESVESLNCGSRVLKLGPIVEIELPDARRYKVAKLEKCLYAGTLLHWVASNIGYSRDLVKSIGLRTQRVEPLVVESLSELPTKESRTRALYSALVPLVSESLRGPLNDVRNEHLAQGADIEEFAPAKIVAQLAAVERSVASRLQSVPAFGNGKTRSPKSCVSCGVMPEGKYRWKHRICSKCRSSLEKQGYTSWAGYQVQQNFHVPNCYPGLVKVRGEQLPPKASKWEQAECYPTPERELEVDIDVARLPLKRANRPKVWREMEKEDLDKLKAPLPDTWTHVLGGIACSGARPMVSARTGYNCAKALIGRTFLKLPPRPWNPNGGPLPGIWRWVRRFVPLLLPDFRAEKMVFEEWLETMPRHRKAALLRGWNRYCRTGWMKGYAGFTSFVKTELLPGFGKVNGDLTRLEEMLDRAIHGPSEESHCIVGPVVKPLVRKLKKIWPCDGPIFYGSTSPEKLHRWLQDLVAEPRQYMWCDFSMYDRTHSLESWGFLEWLYGDQGDDFRQVMNAWRRPKGHFGPLRYQAQVCNASGRDDTALANALLNGFATYLSACAAWLGVEVMELTLEQVTAMRGVIRLSVCGDDSLGWLPSCSEERMATFRRSFNANIEKFGFVAKLCTSPRVEECVYLGMRPYPTAKGWFWGKTIGRSTYKMGWMLFKEGRDPMAHITGVADMHVLCSSHVPVLADLAKKIVELRQGARRTPVALDGNKPWEWTYQAGVDYDEITLASVARQYSRRSTEGNPCDFEREVTVQDLKDLIATINAVERLPCVLDHWVWKHMIYADDL